MTRSMSIRTSKGSGRKSPALTAIACPHRDHIGPERQRTSARSSKVPRGRSRSGTPPVFSPAGRPFASGSRPRTSQGPGSGGGRRGPQGRGPRGRGDRPYFTTPARSHPAGTEQAPHQFSLPLGFVTRPVYGRLAVRVASPARCPSSNVAREPACQASGQTEARLANATVGLRAMNQGLILAPRPSGPASAAPPGCCRYRTGGASTPCWPGRR
jgi:hypothetical protein